MDNKLLRNRELQKRFVEITNYKELTIYDGIGIVLCHYPIPCFKNHYYGWYHFYGHVHNSFEEHIMQNVRFQMEKLYDKPCKMTNVGAMMPWTDYIPRAVNDLIKILNVED